MSDRYADGLQGNILIVDDTPDNLVVLEGILTDCGYRVRLAPTGELALRSIAANLPDMILLDIRMPAMDGYAVCERLKQQEPTREIPIIFLSALGDVQDKVKGFEAGGVDYITKPFQVNEVLARVKTHLTLHRLQQSLREEILRRTRAEEDLRIANQHLAATNTQLTELNQQLQQANQALHKANASKDAFFSIIAHDLRSPFMALLGLTEVLSEELERMAHDRLKRMLRTIHETAEKTYALLTNLLEWSRLERGLTECRPELFPLAALLERDIRLYAAMLERKQIVLTTHVSPDICLYADLKMVDTVVRNLLSNALKFTAPGGCITITAAPQPNQRIAVVIADTGIGMEPETLAALFQIERKTSRTGTAGEEGTGLGLILCKELVEKNGGTLHVTSVVGQGSRVTVILPTDADAAFQQT